MRRVVAAGVVLVLAAFAGCSSGDPQGLDNRGRDTSSASPAPAKTLTMLPPPEKTLSGEIVADLRQSSRDVALGRFQVWLTNGLKEQVRPTRIVYRDPELTRPVVAQRLRPIPSGSYRGYPLELVEPTCDGSSGKVTLTVEHDGEVETLPVEDETSVVGRWSDERCAELSLDKIAPLEWTPGIEVRGTGSDAIAMFRLTAHPTGRGGSYTIDTVGGTPLFTSADGGFWTVGQRVDGKGHDITVALPAHPARCDAHAFGSATGGTTFLVNLTIAGQGPAQIRLAMSPQVTAETFAYAAEACGWEE